MGLLLADAEVGQSGCRFFCGTGTILVLALFHPPQQLAHAPLHPNREFGGVVLGLAINLRFPFSLVIILAVLWGRPETC